jgi:hypothetical protein
MIEEIKNIRSEKSDLRKFGITFGLILLIIAGFLFWKENESFQIILTIGVVLCVLGITLTVVLKPIYLMWMIFATVLGWIMTRVILSVLFYAILTPIGLILRLFGKQFLELKWNKTDITYWNYRPKNLFVAEKYEKQF